MANFEYEDEEYWNQVYSLDETFVTEKAVTEGNDGENEFDTKMLDSSKGKVVLDVGSGDGVFSIRMAQQGAKSVVGVDFSEVATRIARSNAEEHHVSNATFEKGVANGLHFQDGSFDLITCRRGPVSDKLESLREAFRVSKRRGTLMEITIGERDKENIARIFGRGQMIDSGKISSVKEGMFREAGFESVEVRNYFATEVFPTMEDLVIRLKNSPIIPDFDEVKDQAYLARINRDLMTRQGIRTQTHRVTISARKPT